MKQDYRRLARAVLARRDGMVNLWDYLARRVMPRLEQAVSMLTGDPNRWRHESNSTAMEGVLTLVGACTTLVTPIGEQWFSLSARSPVPGQSGELWFQNAAEVMLKELASSNFYGEKQEADLNLCLFGSGCLLCEEALGGGLVFRNIPSGSYGVEVDKDGEVDTVCRRILLSPWQAVQQFGYDRLPVEVRRLFEREDSCRSASVPFLHLVTPRDVYAAGNGADFVHPLQMRFASVYLYDGADSPVVQEGGYPEFPFMVSRFLRYEGSVWGYPPALMCKDEIEAEVRLERLLDLMSELQAFPRMLTPAEMVGEVDYRAGSETPVNMGLGEAGFPREWGSRGDPRFLLERLAQKQERIKAAFFTNFLKVVSGVERQMTATEVVQRQREQVLAFSPTFNMLARSLSGLLGRVFACLWRQGRLRCQHAEPPHLRVADGDGSQNYALELPLVMFNSQLSQAVRLAQQQNMYEAMQLAQVYQSVLQSPEAFDCLDSDKVVRDLFLGRGASAKLFREEHEVQRIRQQRAEVAAQQQALQAGRTANQYSQAARNLGGIQV